MAPLSLYKLKKKVTEIPQKPKAKINRFNGLTEEEIQKNCPPLPDYLKMNLNLVFIGINPSLMSAYRGRYYAGPGNHFYKLLHESGLISRNINFEEDEQLLTFEIGLTNIVDRATRSSADLNRDEIKQGSIIVEKKLRYYKPKIAIFNGRCIYDVFANKSGKFDFNFGLQSERIGDTAIWVVPSSSARCSNFPRISDKLKFYLSLKKYLSFLNGEINDVDVKEFYFNAGKINESTTSIMWRRKNTSLFLNCGKIANKVTLNSPISDISSINNEFVIKEIRSQNGIEKFENNSPVKEEKNEINYDSKNFKNISVTKKNELKQTFRKMKNFDTQFKKRENSSDFVSLIKERIEAKKRKADDIENS